MILSNQVKCNACGDTPFSRHRHDFVSCKCGKISVDGGMDYLRRSGDVHNYIDMSIDMDNDLFKIICEDIKNGSYNELGILCSVMRHLRDAGYDVNKPLDPKQK
jgi:hypothetical protein